MVKRNKNVTHHRLDIHEMDCQHNVMKSLMLKVVLLMMSIVIKGKVIGEVYQEMTYTNPVLNSNHPDPGVLSLGNNLGYVGVSTSNYAQNSDSDSLFPIIHSPNLVDWTLICYVFPRGKWPKWAKSDFWGPEIHRVEDSYYVYYSARSKKTNIHGIGVAITRNSSNPFGPYNDIGYPIIEDPSGAIDVTWFKDPITKLTYLSWKHNAMIWSPSSICIRRVKSDGFTFNKAWSVRKLLTANFFHDLNSVEGPWYTYRKPYYYMFFSSSIYFTPFYDVSVARSRNIEGPYQRLFGRKVLHTNLDKYLKGENSTFVSPGHCSMVTTPGGSDWLVYHAWRWNKLKNPPGRVLLIDRIYWDPLYDDWPVIGTPSDQPQKRP